MLFRNGELLDNRFNLQGSVGLNNRGFGFELSVAPSVDDELVGLTFDRTKDAAPLNATITGDTANGDNTQQTITATFTVNVTNHLVFYNGLLQAPASYVVTQTNGIYTCVLNVPKHDNDSLTWYGF